jgi:hypothetical protein
MKNIGRSSSYDRFYTAMNFERAGLFKLLKEQYNCGTVLYPGCSIHITPSFYFQHVVYVDISVEAKSFFADNQNVLSIVNSNKKYKQSAYIQFIQGDYTKELPLRENNYDLLLSIYAGGITRDCNKYVRSGGIIVSNNHQNDAKQALEDPSVRLEALIRRRGETYQIENVTGEGLLKALQEHSMSKKGMRNSNSGIKYVDNECYFVFRKKKD